MAALNAEIPSALKKRLMGVCVERDKNIKDAVAEAVALWMESGNSESLLPELALILQGPQDDPNTEIITNIVLGWRDEQARRKKEKGKEDETTKKAASTRAVNDRQARKA